MKSILLLCLKSFKIYLLWILVIKSISNVWMIMTNKFRIIIKLKQVELSNLNIGWL